MLHTAVLIQSILLFYSTYFTYAKNEQKLYIRQGLKNEKFITTRIEEHEISKSLESFTYHSSVREHRRCNVKEQHMLQLD